MLSKMMLLLAVAVLALVSMGAAGPSRAFCEALSRGDALPTRAGPQQPPWMELRRLKRKVVLEVGPRLTPLAARAGKEPWPALSLFCVTESFSAKAVAKSGGPEQVETSICVSGKLEVLGSDRIFVSFEVAGEAKGKGVAGGEKYDVRGSAIFRSGKPVVIFSSREMLLLLKATFWR